MKISDIILEFPITNRKMLVGKFDRPGAMTVKGGRKRVSQPGYIVDAKKAFSNTPFNFRIFISNVPGSAHRKSEYGGYESNLYEKGILGKDGTNVRKLLSDTFEQNDVRRILRNTQNAITVIYAGNYGAELVPLTPWMLAHRLGHAIQASSPRHTNWHSDVVNYFWETINYTLKEYYGARLEGTFNRRYNAQDMANGPQARQIYRSLFNQIGTMKSTQQKNITRPYEFFYECFAQYLIKGSVEFNPLPMTLTYGKLAWGHPQRWLRLKEVYRSEYDRDLGNFANGLNDHFTECLEQLRGNILSI